MSDKYTTREGNTGYWKTHDLDVKRTGSSALVRYYLPVPYVQVYAYEVRLLGKDTLRVGFRPVVAPDTEHPFLIDHNFSSLVDDNLQITTSPEGLLEYVGYRREPKVVEAAGALARAALSMAAPLPGPFKGDDGLPEFSRLVYKENFKVTQGGKHLDGGNPVSSHCVYIAGRMFNISTALLTEESSMKSESSGTNVYRRSVRGLHHRPLMPLRVTVSELGSTDPGQAPSREFVFGSTNLSNEIRFSSPIDSSRPSGALRFPNQNERRNLAGSGIDSSSTNLLVLEHTEAAINISDIVYCPNPELVDTFFIPTAFIAPQSFEIQLAGGSVYDVKIHRRSEVLAFANGVSEFTGSFVRIPAGLFTFTVVHESKSADGIMGDSSDGGGKSPGNYRPHTDKSPGNYRPHTDKD